MIKMPTFFLGISYLSLAQFPNFRKINWFITCKHEHSQKIRSKSLFTRLFNSFFLDGFVYYLLFVDASLNNTKGVGGIMPVLRERLQLSLNQLLTIWT